MADPRPQRLDRIVEDAAGNFVPLLGSLGAPRDRDAGPLPAPNSASASPATSASLPSAAGRPTTSPIQSASGKLSQPSIWCDLMMVRVASSTGPPKPMPTPLSAERSTPARASNSGTA